MTTSIDSDAPKPRTNPDELPFVAPCRRLELAAPIRWLSLGWRDMRAAPRQSFFYGVLLTLLSLLIAIASWRLGMVALYLGLASGFVFIGPILAVGLYSISYQLGIGRQPTLAYSLREGRAHLKDTLVLGICLLVVLLVWARAATILSVLRPSHALPSWRDLLPYFGFGSAVGAVFCAIIFSATAFALPMLLDRRTDAITAVVTSINATLRNKGAMALWAAIIGIAVALGFATMLSGFVVLLPLLGHATWHAYRETIDASLWPPTHDENA